MTPSMSYRVALDERIMLRVEAVAESGGYLLCVAILESGTVVRQIKTFLGKDQFTLLVDQLNRVVSDGDTPKSEPVLVEKVVVAVPAHAGTDGRAWGGALFAAMVDCLGVVMRGCGYRRRRRR